MTGIFDRLQRKIEDNKQGTGFAALDLAELPPALRKIMRMMLRELELNYPQLLEAMKATSREKRMSRTELNSALNTLTAQQWLIRVGEGEQAIYKVNLKRRSASSLPAGVWTALDAKLKDRPK
jgi:hypothetical protein